MNPQILNMLQRKADELTREVDHWKSVAHHSKQVETKAQDELSAANQRIFELQRLLNEKSVEISTINEQKALLQSQAPAPHPSLLLVALQSHVTAGQLGAR
jgi:hypothetical protein